MQTVDPAVVAKHLEFACFCSQKRFVLSWVISLSPSYTDAELKTHTHFPTAEIQLSYVVSGSQL